MRILRQVLDEVRIVGFSLDFTEQTQKLLVPLPEVLVLVVGQRVVCFEDERAEGAVVRSTCVVLQLVWLQLIFSQLLVSAGAVVKFQMAFLGRSHDTQLTHEAVLPVAVLMGVNPVRPVCARPERAANHLAWELPWRRRGLARLQVLLTEQVAVEFVARDERLVAVDALVRLHRVLAIQVCEQRRASRPRLVAAGTRRFGREGGVARVAMLQVLFQFGDGREDFGALVALDGRTTLLHDARARRLLHCSSMRLFRKVLDHLLRSVALICTAHAQKRTK